MNDGIKKAAGKLVLVLMAVLSAACGKHGMDDLGRGELRIAFAPGQPMVRSGYDLPDTGDFMLKVADSNGKVLYEGTYGACPEVLEVKSGTYSVEAKSADFTKPAFDFPQYGDQQCVVVPAGGVVDVKLVCSQLNSGIRLSVDPSFLQYCPHGVLFLKSDQGKLMYGYSEKRTAYFSPGSVSLVLNESGTDRILTTRVLAPQEILCLGVSAVSGSSGEDGAPGGRISVALDTSRFWLNDNYVIGGEENGGDEERALTVSQALASIGEEDVWVSGYIVGGDLSSSSASFEPPFKSRTNILLGPRSSTTDRSSCLSVQLSSGDLRDNLNLVDNPDMLGRKVVLKGDIVEAYFGIPGLKNISDYTY